MSMKMEQSIRQQMSMVMTPQLQMAIKLLQMARAELVEQVQEELKENPLLEDAIDSDAEHERDEPTDHIETIGETEEPIAQPNAKEQTDAGKEVPVDGQPTNEIDWATFIENSATAPLPAAQERPDNDDLPQAGQAPRTGESLEAHLLEQLRMARLPKDEERCAIFIIGNLDPDGYLKEPPLAEVADECEVSLEVAERALKRVQRFDPWGCGARTLQECLLVQAEMLDIDDKLMVTVITEHLVDIEKKNWEKLAKKLKQDVEEILLIAQEIQKLDPRPGREFSTDQPQYITPDVYIHKVGEKYFVSVNDDGLPKLRISRYYLDTMKGKDNKAARDYVQERLRSAKWLIDSIQQRQRTIVKVTESILKFQRDFFEKGAGHLRPLILRDVASDIGMHESTISRATANKYVHTPQGLYELKYFFNIGINREGGQDEIASEAVKGFIKQLVSGENGKNPYSDQKIVELLKQKHGIEIARRTVAKYREQLGILPSSQRKSFS
ncbi:MAG TPA: RNA polymerase factor sigma-54 [Pseudomonadota bacterium]|nr:RNA polymerase factor sigma-54 [Pseudomonadota bacterium]HNI61333.1 RNA polymerase factor sigma-54 [Pseudomonadota bacterium]HNK44986.1 RNA polymerase factor sigma-54 [Pseudomonadota bacterium]HNN50279.1 RNA polymerase factor sigma-54 [Pseudomonadota bacterium]